LCTTETNTCMKCSSRHRATVAALCELVESIARVLRIFLLLSYRVKKKFKYAELINNNNF
jgi:hypothetical protein